MQKIMFFARIARIFEDQRPDSCMKKFLHKNRRLPFLISLLAVIALMAGLPDWTARARTFHSEVELKRFEHLRMTLPVDTNIYFAASGKCAGCHGHDPAFVAFYTSSGEDVNIADDWAGTMMANAARDPLWRAKVSHEILINPGAQQDVENTCTRCHAPTGRFEAEYTGQMPYSMAALMGDSIAEDGVNCSACHQLKDTLAGRNFTGDLYYTRKIFYGPYTNPFAGPMFDFNGFMPVYSTHINRATLCGGCHTLITETRDIAGNATGNYFVEQATYHEWLNSVYSDTMSPLERTCQSCHIPRIADPVDIATNYPFLQSRTPFGKHHLIGGNAFMLKILRNNMTTVGATCNPSNYDTTIARTIRNLRDSTLDAQLTETARTVDTVFYKLALTNKAGHKFPSGYPARRAYVEFVVMDDIADTIFRSGLIDANGNIMNEDVTYEPHYDMINDEQQVQIYQMVMGDVNNNVNTVLLRADTTLKDNRLAPKGFTTSHFAYDTCRIYGNVLTDPDFNLSGGVTEGTGADTLHYHIPLNGYTGNLNVTARVYYQSVPAKFVADMFTLNSAPIDTFKNLFNNADHTPMLVAECLMGSIVTGTNTYDLPKLVISPNPTSNGQVRVMHYQDYDIRAIRVYDLSGKLVSELRAGNFNGVLQLPHRGVFMVSIETAKKRYAQKVIYY
ncbi:MAG: hypothetical protein FD123_1952 [Bacteroidetes bacterium]|nr:MAG: hypothetical protein FD123_1952 [Bacteroidota bacterium]